MKKMVFGQMAMAWLIIAVVVVDVMKRNSIITMVAELFSLIAAMGLVVKI